ncbi:hypothetical protein B2H91_16120 [Clostridium botulinum]|uniref:hypothetical protein n=1 Tax=Clostridium botulinum TaxID=1491 RepID=UPI000A172DDB|nr:hypothetical protein [Clostridium botulinum]AUN19793.1 hypothetical protein B2M06_19770 [Clostridium botulinum]OSA84506.1 hypothetical protein B2H91_16120 [Clostridium botulinum]
MEEGKCLTKDICVLRLNTFEAECYLNFGINTKFDFKYVSVNKVRLERKNMEFTIPKESFIKLFKVC